ncbi:MAG: class I SAM-dependent methyltransferase [Gemmataceae bacterium]
MMLSRMKASLGGRLNRCRKFLRSLYRYQHQLTSTTGMNRYPELFAEVRDLLGAKRVRVLSYGCSTGEECATLEKCLETETIIGADINESNLRAARERFPSTRIEFIKSSAKLLAARAPYDIVFCLSVLCRWEDTRDVEECSSIYPFEKFASAVLFLDSLLPKGGLLVIYNANFRFEDTATFLKSGYTAVASPAVVDSGFVHKFDQNNRRIRETHRTCIYRKGERGALCSGSVQTTGCSPLAEDATETAAT